MLARDVTSDETGSNVAFRIGLLMLLDLTGMGLAFIDADASWPTDGARMFILLRVRSCRRRFTSPGMGITIGMKISASPQRKFS
jgi:hypothetical protein